jgi:hypothetical protein
MRVLWHKDKNAVGKTTPRLDKMNKRMVNNLKPPSLLGRV